MTSNAVFKGVILSVTDSLPLNVHQELVIKFIFSTLHLRDKLVTGVIHCRCDGDIIISVIDSLCVLLSYSQQRLQ